MMQTKRELLISDANKRPVSIPALRWGRRCILKGFGLEFILKCNLMSEAIPAKTQLKRPITPPSLHSKETEVELESFSGLKMQ
jgi:hypothetical protein